MILKPYYAVVAFQPGLYDCVVTISLVTISFNTYGILPLGRPQFVVAKGNNIPDSQGSIFATGGPHSCLWPDVTRFNKSQILTTARTEGNYNEVTF